MMDLCRSILSPTIETSAARFMNDDDTPYIVRPDVISIDVHAVFSQTPENFGYV